MLSCRETGLHFFPVTSYSAISWCRDAVLSGVSVSKPGTWPAWVHVECCLWRCCPRVAVEAYCCARLSKQATVFIVGNPLTIDVNTERKRTTQRLGAVLTYGPAAVTEDVIRRSCLLFTVMMLLISGLPVESDGIRDGDVADADCRYSMWPSSWLCALPFVGVKQRLFV